MHFKKYTLTFAIKCVLCAGEELLRHLLKQPVFVQSANLCYLQVSGTSASELIFRESKKLRANDVPNNKANILLLAYFKKKRQAEEALLRTVTIPVVPIHDDFHTQLVQEQKKPINLMSMVQPVMRFKIFYNAQYVKKIGLPANHAFKKKRSTCGDLVISTFLPALSLFSSERNARVSRSALIMLFENIKAAYLDCPVALLMEKHCSIGNLAEQAQPLTSSTDKTPTQEDEEADQMDTSGLFSTPATKSSMQLCEDLPDSELKSLMHSGGSDGYRNSGHRSSDSAGRVDRTAPSRESTWHSTVSSARPHTSSTLANSSEKEMELTATSNGTFHSTNATNASNLTDTSIKAASACAETASATAPSGAVPSVNAAESSVSGGKKRKRGCRAGAKVKLQKQQLHAEKIKPNTGSRKVNEPKAPLKHSHTNTTADKDISSNKRTIAQAIHGSIDQLWKPHTQRELVTVGERLVHSVVQNVKSDMRVQELGINTQNSVKSILSSASSAEKPMENASGIKPAAAGLGGAGESESTYASAPSVVHRATGSDKKRKFVSIQESPLLESADKMARFSSRDGSQQPHTHPRNDAVEFEYFVGSGTPSAGASRPLTQSTGDRSRSDLTYSQQLSQQHFLMPHPPPSLPPPTSEPLAASGTQTSSGQMSVLNDSNVSLSCPAQVGDILLRDCSRAKRKKIKFKFRQFFKRRLLGGITSGRRACGSGRGMARVVVVKRFSF